MGLNQTPSSERVHIGFFGKRNVGKSSIVNAVTGQKLSVVSDVLGTTTDPVYKSMELLPVGPVMIIDTPGFDDEGELGRLRVEKTYQVLRKTDVAVVVADASSGLSAADETLIKLIKEKNIPYIIVMNKSDLTDRRYHADSDTIFVSASEGININELKEKIAALAKKEESGKRIIADLINPGDTVVLVTPIDSAAPKGRLILPQQQTIRDILDSDAIAVVTKETQLKKTLSGLSSNPAMVVTDSQAFAGVSADTPSDIPLTSFSILFARYKGLLEESVKGVAELDKIKNGSRILIAEGCTHHRQCEDIGTVKLPGWIRKYTGADPEFSFVSGTEFPDDISGYDMIIHCGGCMLNENEMRYRMKCACDNRVPITNYGMVIAYINGILARSLELFPDILSYINR